MSGSAVSVFLKRAKRTQSVRKRPVTSPVEGSASESDHEFTDDEASVRTKRRKNEGVKAYQTTSSSARDIEHTAAIPADRSRIIITNQDATRVSTRYSGPVKAPANIRTTTITDFAPDVCKNYKQTGFCGFGDCCKFLHIREDYKQGWQLDKEQRSMGSKKKDSSDASSNASGNAESYSTQEDAFACIICKKHHTTPVVTKCGHHFCERCAVRRYRNESKTCAACGTDTGGSFGMAKNLKRALENKRRRMEVIRDGAGENGFETGHTDNSRDQGQPLK